jgi:tetratricopeptide (TPR) repeat protein
MINEIARLEQMARRPQDWGKIADAYVELAAQHPKDYRLFGNSAHARWLSGDAAQAGLAYRRAVLINPTSHILYRGLGNTLVDLGDFEAAERAYRRSLELCLEDETNWNLSQLLIGMGRLQEGYDLAESRWGLQRVTAWRSEPINTRQQALDRKQPLLVWSEQGLGDILQHLRWIFLLQELRGTTAQPLRIEVEGSLVGLIRRLVDNLQPCPQVQEKAADHASGWGGLHISLLSLPRLLGFTCLETSQIAQVVKTAFTPVVKTAGSPRLGLVWAAGRKLDDPITAREYWLRSLDQQALGQVIRGVTERGCQCVALQFGPDRELAAPWSRWFADQLSADADFEVTAELVLELDLVITVDTAMAHLAGVLGKPVWVLLPVYAAPRWGRGNITTAWYPTMRLFRQLKPWDWTAPIEQMCEALSSWMTQS